MRPKHTLLLCLFALCVPAIAVAAHAPLQPHNAFLHASALLQEEVDLLPLAGPAQGADPLFGANRGRLEYVDGSGAAILRRLRAAGIQPSPVLVRTLDRLPPPVFGAPRPPSPAEYRAAIAELHQLEREHSGESAFGLPEVPAASPTSAGGRDWLMIGLAGLIGAVAATGGVVVHRLRSGRAESADDLRAIALTDPLTGLGNRRKLDEDIAETAHVAATQLSVLMIDVDHFKDVNDRHGHPLGDEVLRCVSRVLQERTRAEGAVYRYGGEEFCVVLWDALLPAAQAVADRLRSSLATASMPIGWPVTISVGVATGVSHEIAAVIRHADAALYEAKRAGRDTVRTFTTMTRPTERTASRVETGSVVGIRG